MFTNYSYSVSPITNGTPGINGSGYILNVTTLNFIPTNFTIGNINLNLTNTDINDLFFERIDINATSLLLNVTYPNTWDLACDFNYKFALNNKTYTNLDNVTISNSEVESSFRFLNVDNEIIDVYCWDQIIPTNDGSYLITQTSFPLLDQIANVRSGEYGFAGSVVEFVVIVLFVIRFNSSSLTIVNSALSTGTPLKFTIVNP